MIVISDIINGIKEMGFNQLLLLTGVFVIIGFSVRYYLLYKKKQVKHQITNMPLIKPNYNQIKTTIPIKPLKPTSLLTQTKIIIKDEPKIIVTKPISITKIPEYDAVQEIKKPFDKTQDFDNYTANQTKPKEPLSGAVVEPKVAEREIKFVNYNLGKPENKNSFPLLRFPKRDTVVRSYRSGNTKRRSYKEESFQNSITRYFGKDFLVLGDARLNTGRDTRPYEPDIAIVELYTSTNLRIDIEIDEPYAGISRQPTHCKGDDTNRDNYFIERGWIVVRFTEHQVHLFEGHCLKFIAQLIKAIIPNYIIPAALVNHSDCVIENQWDIVQGQKWEKDKFRETYLNHTFGEMQQKPETAERGINVQEAAEERFVKPTDIGTIDQKKAELFNMLIEHARDHKIKFYPVPHVYKIDNIPAPSVSTVISKFFPEFDSVKWSNKKAPELGMSAENIQEMWDEKGKKAASDGHYLHEQIEKFYLKAKYDQPDGFHLFKDFHTDHSNLKPYRSEWRIYDEQYHIAGTIDLIVKTNEGYEMYDWKRSKKVVNPLTGEPLKINKWQAGIGKLSSIDDTSYNHYCLQQSIYRYILEKNYGIEISKMYLVVLYPEYQNYFKVAVPYLKGQIEYILRSI